MPLVSAMTVIVIAAAFGSSADRSVMSSRAAAGTDRLFRNGHRQAFNTTQECVFKKKKKVNAVLMFSFFLLVMSSVKER